MYTFNSTGETRLINHHIDCNSKNVIYMIQYKQNDLQQRFNGLEQGVIFRVWALKRVSVFAFLVLKQGQDSRTFAAHPYPKFAGVPRKLECVLTSNEVHFVSLAENLTV